MPRSKAIDAPPLGRADEQDNEAETWGRDVLARLGVSLLTPAKAGESSHMTIDPTTLTADDLTTLIMRASGSSPVLAASYDTSSKVTFTCSHAAARDVHGAEMTFAAGDAVTALHQLRLALAADLQSRADMLNPPTGKKA